MELQLKVAASLLPLKTDRPAPPKKLDDGGTDFKNYLDGVRDTSGKDRLKPVDKPAPKEKAKVDEPSEDHDNEADATADAPSEQVVVAAPVVTILPSLPVDGDIAPVEGEAKTDTPSAGNVLRSNRISEASATGTPIQGPILPSHQVPDQPIPGSEGAALTSDVNPTPEIAPGASTPLTEETITTIASTTTSAQAGKPIAAKDVDTTGIKPKPNSGTQTDAAAPSSSTDESSPSDAKIAPVQARPEKESSSEDDSTPSQRESLREQVAANASKLKSKEIAPRFDASRLESSDAEATQQARPTPQHAKPKTDAFESQIRHIDIKSGNGDSAAASLGRFLISGAADASNGTANVAIGADALSVSGASATTGGTRSSASVSTPAPAQTLTQLLSPPVQSADVVGAAAKVLSASANGGRQQVTLQLDPPELGQLKLQIRMQQDAMTLRVDANSQAVAKLIESRLPELKDALATHGIRVDRSEVVVAKSASLDNQPQHQGDHQQSSTSQQQEHHQFNESRSSWAEGGRFGGASYGGSEGRQEHAETVAAPEFEQTLGGASWFDGNDTSPSTELWLDLVA